jgi:hypothetical protein
MYSGVPVLWVLKMQNHIALSKMDAVHHTFTFDARPRSVREILKDTKHFVLLDEGYIPKCTTHSKAFKEVGAGDDIITPSVVYADNEACLKFAKMPKLPPHTKHIRVPFYWFCTKTINLEIFLKPIVSVDQLTDQFTKGLTRYPFENGRMTLMGWRIVKLLF